MKKILFLFFATILVNRVWAYDFKSGKLCYNITSNNTVEVTEGNYSNLSTIIIPNEVIFKNITYSVTSIGIAAFSDCSGLTSVTIPNSVTNIESGAFYDCNKLSSVSIGSSVTSIGEDTFFGCNNLKFNTYDNAHYLGNVENLYVVLFEAKNRNITSCVIANNCRVINDMAFYDCQLAQISIPNSVVSIGRYAFGNCKLTSVTIPKSVTSIGELAFSDCKKLKSVVIPNSVTTIASSVFFGCSNLTTVTIPNSVTSIGNNAFSGCGCLTSITTDCEIIGGANLYLAKDGIRYKVLNKDSIEVASNSYSGEIVIPASVTAGNTFIVASIGDYAFRRCNNLTSINIPNSVTSIGVGAFTGCNGLTSITIPNSVTNIGEGAFDECLNLKNYYFQAGTKPTGWNAKWENKDKPSNKTFTHSEISKRKDVDYSGIDQISEKYGMVLVGRSGYISARIAKFNDGKEFVLSISLHDDIEWPLDGKYLVILGEDYASFEKNMAVVNEKFAKWTQIAKTDGVKNFRKTIVDFGDRIGRTSLFEMRGVTKLYAVFEVDENGKCLLKFGSQEIDDSKYAYSNYAPYYTFYSPEDFGKLYEIIKYDNAMKNYEIMKSKIDAKKKAIEDRDAKFD